MPTIAEPLDLYRLGESSTTSSWLVSEWGAGQTNIMDWSANNVRVASDGAIELVLDNAPTGTTDPFMGGEIQSTAVATTGTWSWTAQAPRMVDGAVFGMFLYQADWAKDPWLEFDFEFVGADTTKVQLAVHMVDAAGQHITNLTKMVVDLGFDAALDFHTYEIVLDGTSANFMVDGRLLETMDGSDMPGGVWNTGALKSYVDLWAADSRYDSWTGAWVDPDGPLVARLANATVQPGVLPPAQPVITPPPQPVITPTVQPIVGTALDNTLKGTDNGEVIDGQGGHDTLLGEGGSDTLLGGTGDDRLDGGIGNDLLQGGDGQDRLVLDAGSDRLDGGAGLDWVVVTGTTNATINLGATAAQDTGAGLDTLVGIENALGGVGNDRLTGSAGANTLQGGAGADTLDGGLGVDRMEGGTGDDTYLLSEAADLIVELAGAGTDTVQSAIATTLGATLENLILTGASAIGGTGNTGANRLTGNNAANMLSGLAGADVLVGNGGNDRLIGGAGADTVSGGAGDDVFRFATMSERGDVITDFRNQAGNNDRFEFSAAGFGMAVGTLSASRLQIRADNVAQDGDDRFIFRTTDQTLWYDNNGKDPSGLTLLADLDSGAMITASDFIFV
ncbi:family 16 glycosylhydrolase [Rubellimicrobium rubrum]|nr:family 16 glycosylhydrolase [Rubellimicrobium rubrum]